MRQDLSRVLHQACQDVILPGGQIETSAIPPDLMGGIIERQPAHLDGDGRLALQCRTP